MKTRDEIWAPKPRPRPQSVGRRWRAQRDLVIFLAATHGASYRFLSDVFDLPNSRIAAIVKNMKSKCGDDPTP